MPVNAAYTIYFFLNHHCTNSLSSLHIFVHHCTFCASLHTKTSLELIHSTLCLLSSLGINNTCLNVCTTSSPAVLVLCWNFHKKIYLFKLLSFEVVLLSCT